MKIRWILLFGVLIIITVSCSKDLNTPLDAEKIAVVESYLIAGDSTIKVSVSKLLPFSEDTTDAVEPITGLTLKVNGLTLEESAPGEYSLPSGMMRVKPDSAYTLRFLYFGDSVSSTTTIPAKPTNLKISATTIYTERITSSGGFPSGPMEDVDITWDNDDNSYYYVTIQYLESTPDYINYAMEDQEVPTVTGIAPVQSSGTRLGMRNLYFFGKYRVVLYKVNKEFADLYQHMTANSNNITTPVTSIHHGYGVFTGMSTDTVYLQVREN